MKFVGKGYDSTFLRSRNIQIVGFNCDDKKNIRIDNKKIVGGAFAHSGCYIFFCRSINSKPGKIYVGQARYFDSRFFSHERLDPYKEGVALLIHRIDYTSGEKMVKHEYNEADIQHLEFLLIDYFKNQCFGSDYILENIQSGTPSVGSPNVKDEISKDFEAIIRSLNNKFKLDIFRTRDTSRTFEIITAEKGVNNTKEGKRYQLTVERDPKSQLFRVKKESEAVAHHNASYWHHKLIHKRLDEEGYFGPRIEYKTTPIRGLQEYFKLKKDWIAMNLSEIVGALTNGNAQPRWHNSEGKRIDSETINKWKR